MSWRITGGPVAYIKKDGDYYCLGCSMWFSEQGDFIDHNCPKLPNRNTPPDSGTNP